MAVNVEPITFTGRLTYEDLLEVHRIRWRFEASRRLGVRGALWTACLVALIFHVNDHADEPLWVPLGIILIGCLPWTRREYRRLSERWKLRRQKDRLEEATAIFTDDSVALSDETSGVRLAWRRLAAIVATPRGILFLTPPQQTWFYLPQRLFDGNSHRDDILASAGAKGVRIFRLK